MFRKYLEKDLEGIFEKEVEFSNSLLKFGSELGVIFVVLDQDGIKNNFREGENYFSVLGSVEIVNDAKQTNFGFFNQRKSLNKFEAFGEFRLLGRESNESISNSDSERILIKKSQRFNYRISIPYNKSIGDIEEITFNAIME